jgi:hypothetical protein
MKKRITYSALLTLFAFLISNTSIFGSTGDTTLVQTFRFDSTMRAGVFLFPDDTSKTYEKIIMQYSMRCKDGLISTGTQRNLGCGEWDYNCFTYIVDSSQTDSLLRSGSSLAISNYTGSTLYYSSSPIWNYISSTQTEVTYTSTVSESTATPASGILNLTEPFSGTVNEQRSQYLWTAAELSGAGLIAGDITGIRLNVLAAGGTIDNLRLKLRHSNLSTLNSSQPVNDGYTEVYHLNTAFPGTGIQSFNFSTPFTWDGTSNLILDVSYSLPSGIAGTELQGHDAGFDAALSSNGPDSWLSFDGSLSIMKFNPAIYSNISDKITIGFWAYGDPAALPAANSVFFGRDQTGTKQLNVHLPWSNSRIFWDCGTDAAGLDRIDKLAPDSVFEGRWNYWTFTKNALTGSMKIFLNGSLWHSDVNKTKLIQVSEMILGSAFTGNPYRGKLDDFSIWNTDLDSNAIKQIIFEDINSSHPAYTNLLVWYKFDAGSGNTALDSGPGLNHSDLIHPLWNSTRGMDLRKNYLSDSKRPDVTFVQGVYTTSMVQNIVLDSIPAQATSVVSYNTVDNSLNSIDTIYVWKSGYSYTFNENGQIIDSTQIPVTDTLQSTTLQYHEKRPMYFELINFITPYGINLDLDGLNGRTWEFDVTDFAPVLKGAKYMAMQDGKYQEDNDIKFVFYEGTPPRTVKAITQIWPNASWSTVAYNDIYNDVYFEPRDITLGSDVTQAKIRSAVSGHGQEGEFIPRTHTIALNSSINLSRSVWTECASNPIYPQGGTWVYDRAGWCPGAAVDLKEWNITSNVSPGQTLQFDYSVPFVSNPGTSNYRINNQLVSYGDPNFTTDASVYAIQSPSKRPEFIRANPLCDDPVIVIRNNGAGILGSLDITYGRDGGPQSTYHWTGNLNFLDTALIVLPAPDWLTSGIDRFKVAVSNPNGNIDQYPANDTMSSGFNSPDTYHGSIVFEFKTNNFPTHNRYTLMDNMGNVILTRQGTVANTIYTDTLNLNPGCYSLYLSDAGGDGLEFWANTSQGTGFFRIRSAATWATIKTLDPDFGNYVSHQFMMNYQLDVPAIENLNPKLTLFPNPAATKVSMKISASIYSEPLIKIYDITGRLMMMDKIRISNATENAELDISQLKAGVYYVELDSNSGTVVEKLVINR